MFFIIDCIITQSLSNKPHFQAHENASPPINLRITVDAASGTAPIPVPDNPPVRRDFWSEDEISGCTGLTAGVNHRRENENSPLFNRLAAPVPSMLEQHREYRR